ncbi:MAG TPA: HYExAFE family protein [Gemmataceae bacterium]|nr:HYExAFE family protein [Gemmataceae bacterium]
MDRGNHYETAFEAYLRDRRLAYVAVDESRRSSLDDEPVKSIDFIVYGAGGEAKLLIDVKGRRFPGGAKERPRHTWQNWVEREDVEGLERWEVSFGSEYRGLLVFAYDILPHVELRPGTADVWVWRGRRYLIRAVPVADYRLHMRVRSPKWDTVHLPTAAFRSLVRPLRDYTHPHEVTAG